MASTQLLPLFVALSAAVVVAQESTCSEPTCAQSDEVPLLQVHGGASQKAWPSMQGVPKMPVNGPGVPKKKAETITTEVHVKNTVVVIPGQVIIGQNVTSGSGNQINLTTELKQILNDAAEAASDSTAKSLDKAVEEIKPPVELPRFVTDNTTIWLQDVYGKHILPVTDACSACGCFYDEYAKPSKWGNYDFVTKDELDAMQNGDDFSCEAFMPPMSMLEEMGVILTRESERKHGKKV